MRFFGVAGWRYGLAGGLGQGPAVREQLLAAPARWFGGDRSRAGGRLSGSGGGWVGGLAGGGQLKFSPLATTRMMCPEPSAATETRFVQALGTVKTYYVTDAALELRDGPTIVARFRATPASPDK